MGADRAFSLWEVAPNAVLIPIFLAVSNVIPGFLWARITLATCSRASGGKYSPNLCVPSLVPLHAGNGPQLLEQARAVGVDGQGELARKQAGRTVHAVAVPFDLAVPSGNDREPFRVGLNAEPVRLRYLPQLLNGTLPLRHLSPTRLSDHWGSCRNRTVLSSRLHEGVAG